MAIDDQRRGLSDEMLTRYLKDVHAVVPAVQAVFDAKRDAGLALRHMGDLFGNAYYFALDGGNVEWRQALEEDTRQMARVFDFGGDGSDWDMDFVRGRVADLAELAEAALRGWDEDALSDGAREILTEFREMMAEREAVTA